MKRTLSVLIVLFLGATGCSDQSLAPEIELTLDATSSAVATASGITLSSIEGPTDPVAVSTPVQITSHFAGASGDTHTGVIRWGDGASSVATITETDGGETATATRSYVLPGVYTVEVEISNQSGESVLGTHEYVTVYDPDGGYVSGNGAILSPPNACAWSGCVADEGAARFGFSSRYRNGATVPDGNTRFTFRDGNFTFGSTEYEWLVIAGARAQYKGVGTVNREGNYGFMLTAIDSDRAGGSEEDRFRIKIWDRDNGDAVVYDNQAGEGDDADLTADGTRLTRGSITIRNITRNEAPVVIITSPANGATFIETEGLLLSADAGDAEDGDLSAFVVWSSDLAGELGVGAGLPDVGLEPGLHTLTASVMDSGGLEAAASVTVEILTITISVSPTAATIPAGEVQQFTAAVYADEVEMLTGAPTITWSSSNQSVATIDSQGLATGVSAGEAAVMASVGHVSSTAVLTVEEAAASTILAETITGGTWHSCGLSAAGKAYCWGDNNYGQLGDASNIDRTLPVAVEMPAGVSFTSISAGETYIVALTSDGKAYAWGNNQSGQLGNGSNSNSNRPVAVNLPAQVVVASVRAGSHHAVALGTSGAAYAWGDNYSGQLGDGSNTKSNVPVAVNMPPGVTFVAIGAGTGHSLALTGSGEAYAWGDNRYGQLGNGTTWRRNTPVAVSMPSGVAFTTIGAGSYHTVALTSTGAAYAWGHNSYGQVGDGGTAARYTPTAAYMPGAVSFTSIDAGVFHTVALASTGAAYAWGHNSYGQLGNGTQTHNYTPTGVSMPVAVSFTSIGAGLQHTMAITSTGEAYAWGLNNAFQLGDGTNTNRNTPVAVRGAINFAH